MQTGNTLIGNKKYQYKVFRFQKNRFLLEDDPDHHDISDSPGEAMDVEDTTVIACDHTDENIDPKRTAALFLLTFKEKFNLSQKAVDYAVGSITTLVNQVSTSLQQSVQHVLKDRRHQSKLQSG